MGDESLGKGPLWQAEPETSGIQREENLSQSQELLSQGGEGKFLLLYVLRLHFALDVGVVVESAR